VSKSLQSIVGSDQSYNAAGVSSSQRIYHATGDFFFTLSRLQSSSANNLAISIRFASKNLFPSFRTSNEPSPASRLVSIPLRPPAVNHEKLGCEPMNAID
jgi:hypothetical protein